MRWGLRSTKQQQRESLQRLEQERQQGSKGKNKAIFSSFSPLAWLAKLTAKNGVAATKVVHATSAAKNTAQAATAFPSCFHKPTSPSTASASASRSSLASSSSSAAEAEAAAGIVPRRDDTTGDTVAGTAPRRRSVGNDDTCRTEAATARQLYHRRHYSVGGDRDLPPLGHLVSLSPKAPPTPAPVRTLTPMLPPLPSDTDEEKRTTRSRRRRRRRVVSGRRSFSSAKAPAGGRLAGAVLVRSPRPSAAAAAVSELERFAVVRRTRDPQRAFRESMVEMIANASATGGGPAAPPRPEELERLLACYLSLNADEHHDCIVKVFRQVWFEYVRLLPRPESGGRRRPPTARRC